MNYAREIRSLHWETYALSYLHDIKGAPGAVNSSRAALKLPLLDTCKEVREIRKLVLLLRFSLGVHGAYEPTDEESFCGCVRRIQILISTIDCIVLLVALTFIITQSYKQD